MQQVITTVRENRQISPTFYFLTFDWRSDWGTPQPGSFLEVRVSEGIAPLLRRPLGFSFYDPNLCLAGLIYEQRGTATTILTNKKSGEPLDIIAPLGTTFGVTGTPKKVLAVGGGVGLGPALFAAQIAHNTKIPYELILGYRNKDLVPNLNFVEHLHPIICTDDGSVGYHGNVVSYMSEQKGNEGATIQACGPIPMLAACHRFATENGLICEVSMEEMMACGVGACSGCVVEMSSGNLTRVCKEGPVYNSKELSWL